MTRRLPNSMTVPSSSPSHAQTSKSRQESDRDKNAIENIIPSSSPPVFSQDSIAGPSSTPNIRQKRKASNSLSNTILVSSDTEDDGDDLDVQVVKAKRKKRQDDGSIPAQQLQREHNQSAPTNSNERRTLQVHDIEDDSDDQDDLVDLTQTEDIDDASLEKYGIVESRIVGVQYYDGIASLGEQVILTREPENENDANAIRVDNVQGNQIGHIPRTVASKLAPFLDDRSIKVEGVLTGALGVFDCPIDITVFGTNATEYKMVLTRRLAEAKIKFKVDAAALAAKRREKELAAKHKKDEAARKKLAAQRAKQMKAGKGGAAPGPGNGGDDLDLLSNNPIYAGNSTQPDVIDVDAEWENLTTGAVAYTSRDAQSVVEKFGKGENELEQMTMAKQPDSLSTKLLPYQLQGLAWMLQSEHPVTPQNRDEVVQLWKVHPKFNTQMQHIATNYSCSRQAFEASPEHLMSGGILSDDMGLGKTIQLIALMSTDPKSNPEIVPKIRVMSPEAKTTLIVAPVSVMSTWKDQIAQHMVPDKKLSVYVYHGPERNHLVLKDHDVVITTYDTLTQDYDRKKEKQEKKLYSVKWRRIILDEAHGIRNPKSVKSVAAAHLEAESRWCLTGTPVVNKLQDLYSLVRFLRMSGGLAISDMFNRTIVRPVMQNMGGGSAVLQALVSTICLRRLKSMKFVNLNIPPLTEHKIPVVWYKSERERYDMLDSEAKGLLATLQRGKQAESKSEGPNYRHVLEVLLRMRQVCNHIALVGERVEALMRFAQENPGQKVAMNHENISLLQDLLQLCIDQQEECPICFDTLSAPVITTCKHVFDMHCISRVIETGPKCPMCRTPLPTVEGSIVEPRVIKEEQEEPEPVSDAGPLSSKISSLLHILDLTRKRDNTVKVIIFSQWTKFLDLIEPHLIAANYGYTRIDGTMNVKHRDTALKKLNNDPECTIMLASLSVCSVGLNLVAASTVILMDSWWAPAIEDQAVDRVHRLGQKRLTNVFRLVMEDSIEERVMLIQEKKRKLVSSAFRENESVRDKSKQTRLADLQTLLG